MTRGMRVAVTIVTAVSRGWGRPARCEEWMLELFTFTEEMEVQRSNVAAVSRVISDALRDRHTPGETLPVTTGVEGFYYRHYHRYH